MLVMWTEGQGRKGIDCVINVLWEIIGLWRHLRFAQEKKHAMY